MKSIRVIMILLLLSSVVYAQQQDEVQLFHYNLFKTNANSNYRYKVEKERTLGELLREQNATFFSILEDGSDKGFVSEKVFSGKEGYDVNVMEIPQLKHTFYFDKNRINVFKSEVYDSNGTQFFYYRLGFKMTASPIHLFVYKQSKTVHPIRQYEEIFSFLKTRAIKGKIVLLGGRSYPMTPNESYFSSLPDSNIEFVNLLSLKKLYGAKNKFIWHDGIDLFFVSTDLWLGEEGGLMLKRVDRNFAGGSLADKLNALSENKPLFANLTSVNSKDTKTVYKIPETVIISQNKKELFFSVVWDEDVTLNIEIVSMIGNSFLSKNVKYQGKPIESVAEVSNYPTGIYLLKVTDENGRMIIRKFTKY